METRIKKKAIRIVIITLRKRKQKGKRSKKLSRKNTIK